MENVGEFTQTTGVETAMPAVIDHEQVVSPLTARGARFSLITGIAGLTSLEEDWRTLEALAARSYGVFQSYDWCAAWSKIYANGQGDNELALVAGFFENSLVVLWPLMRVGRGPTSIVRWLSEPFAQYGDVLVRPGHNARQWLAASWDFICKLKGIATVRLRHVREDAVVFPFLQEKFRSGHVTDGAPFLDLSPYADEEAYERRYSKEQRKRRRKIRKDMESRGPAEFKLLKVGSDMDRAMQQALAEKEKWLAERSLFSPAVGCPNLFRFLRELSRASKSGSLLVTSVFSAGGTPISWEIGLRYADRHHGFITAHDTSLTDASPARLHMDMSQRQAIKDGIKIFDLMVPNDPHKQSWSSAVMPVHDFYAPVSALGWAYGVIYLEMIRPVLRHVYYHVPSLRPLLTGAVKLRSFLP